jgi:hypothetical protein
LQQKSESTSVFGHIPTTTLAGGQVVPVLANGAEFLQMAGIYSAGYAAVFAIFSLMYWHAWRRRAGLELTELERVETRYSAIENLMHVGVGLLAVVLAIGVRTTFAMFAFFLIVPLQIVHGRMRGQAKKRLQATATTGRLT